MLSFQLDIWCIKSIRQTDIKLDYRHHLIFTYRLRFPRWLQIHLLLHSVSLCLFRKYSNGIAYEILSNFRFVSLIRKVEIRHYYRQLFAQWSRIIYRMYLVNWMNAFDSENIWYIVVLWVHTAQCTCTNKRTNEFSCVWRVIASICTLQIDIYNQNGNLFGYETTLRLECIKWQLPLFLFVNVLNSIYLWCLIYMELTCERYFVNYNYNAHREHWLWQRTKVSLLALTWLLLLFFLFVSTIYSN